LKDLEASVYVHFVMKCAVIASRECGLPALMMLALLHAHHMWLVLSEVKDLSRVYLTSHRFMKIMIGDLSILVSVKLVEDSFKLVVGHVESPLLKIEPELFCRYCSRLLLVKIDESLSDGFPLELDLINYRFF
jgi:hypothetical protein